MAEINKPTKNINKKRLIKKSTRVDLTPMVDLGFLLITFFVFTTTMATITTMGMATPKEEGSLTEIAESTVITIIPCANNELYYYEGLQKNAQLLKTSYNIQGLRKVLSIKKVKVNALNKDVVLIIKPTEQASFNNVVNIIDESKINGYKRYYLDDTKKVDSSLLNTYY